MAADSPTSVRLVIATDWDVGFQLTPDAPPLDDIPPGGEYVAECVPQRSVMIHEVDVRGFQLVQISVGKQEVETRIVSDGPEYRLAPPLVVLAGEHILARLRNDDDFPRRPKVAELAVDPFMEDGGRAQTIESKDRASRLRAKLGVLKASAQRSLLQVCAPQSSAELVVLLDALVAWMKHPELRDEIIKRRSIEDARGEPLEEIADAMIARATAALALERTMGEETAEPPDAVDRPEDDAASPACVKAPGDSCDAPASHPSQRATRVEEPLPEDMHAPRIARTLNEGPHNRTLIRGCSCGAAVMSAEAFAAHVGWPVDAIQSMLRLAGIAYDLIDHHGHPDMQRANVARNIARCLMVRL